MTASFITVSLADIMPFFLPAKLLSKYIIFAVDFLARVPYAYLEIDYLWRGWAGLYYVIVGWIIYKIKNNRPRNSS